MNNIAQICFQHDMEDGWYCMKEPTGVFGNWDVCKNAAKFANDQGWKVEWAGSDQYKPNDFHTYGSTN